MSIPALSSIPTIHVKRLVVYSDTSGCKICHPCDMNDTETMGSRIKKLRKARKQAQADVAAALDISRSHLAEIEGGSHPGFATFIELAAYFSVSLDYLYAGAPLISEDLRDRLIKDDEKILIDFWRSLDEQKRSTLLDLLVRDKDRDAA